MPSAEIGTWLGAVLGAAGVAVAAASWWSEHRQLEALKAELRAVEDRLSDRVADTALEMVAIRDERDAAMAEASQLNAEVGRLKSALDSVGHISATAVRGGPPPAGTVQQRGVSEQAGPSGQ